MKEINRFAHVVVYELNKGTLVKIGENVELRQENRYGNAKEDHIILSKEDLRKIMAKL